MSTWNARKWVAGLVCAATTILMLGAAGLTHAQSAPVEAGGSERNWYFPCTGELLPILDADRTPAARSQSVASVRSARRAAGVGWTVLYRDVDNATGMGFDDPVLGAARRAVFEQVLEYVSSFLDHGPATIWVNVRESIDEPTGLLASAGTEFPILGASGFYGGKAFDHITTGIDPDPSTPDINVRVNFFPDYYLGTGIPDPDQLDFYTLILHEIGHGLGFLSTTLPTGNSVYGTNVRSHFDRDLRTGLGERLFDFKGEFLGTPDWLTGSREGVRHYGDGVRAEVVGVGAIHTPQQFAQGTSMSHWIMFDDPFNFNVAAVMQPFQLDGEVQRQFLPFELAAFTDIGYSIASNFGLTNRTGFLTLGGENYDFTLSPLNISPKGGESYGQPSIGSIGSYTIADWASFLNRYYGERTEYEEERDENGMLIRSSATYSWSVDWFVDITTTAGRIEVEFFQLRETGRNDLTGLAEIRFFGAESNQVLLREVVTVTGKYRFRRTGQVAGDGRPDKQNVDNRFRVRGNGRLGQTVYPPSGGFIITSARTGSRVGFDFNGRERLRVSEDESGKQVVANRDFEAKLTEVSEDFPPGFHLIMNAQIPGAGSQRNRVGYVRRLFDDSNFTTAEHDYIVFNRPNDFHPLNRAATRLRGSAPMTPDGRNFTLVTKDRTDLSIGYATSSRLGSYRASARNGFFRATSRGHHPVANFPGRSINHLVDLVDENHTPLRVTFSSPAHRVNLQRRAESPAGQ